MKEKKCLVPKFEDRITMIDLYFIHVVLNGVDSFNILLQSKEPKIHVLHEEIIKLYKHFLVKLVRLDILANNSEGELLEIDFSNVSIQRDNRSLFIGFSTRQAL